LGGDRNVVVLNALQATADIQDTIARAQLKDTELAEVQAQITCKCVLPSQQFARLLPPTN
jgi:hypothetical protein